jgi:predicted dehydrogenase
MTRGGRTTLPRVGFAGTGWIGLNRLEALSASGLVEIAGICDSDPAARARAGRVAPDAVPLERYADLLDLELDGVVIATPSGLHAEQCRAAFARGAAVFCQKPLARTAEESRAVLAAAESADRLLAVDFCYRQTAALRRLRELVRAGEIGEPMAAELVFHNAYGPDKSWANDAALSGGGCLIDLGVHLVDALLWILDFPSIERHEVRLFRDGAPLDRASSRHEVEDFASGAFALSSGPNVTFACSWRSSFGVPAQIRVQLFGTRGGAAFQNVAGSFYDFECELYRGTARETLVRPPDEWGGRAIVAWAEALAKSRAYTGNADLLAVAEALDALYGRARSDAPARRRVSALQAGSP